MIFERWIMAADRLGALQSGLATGAYTVRDLSQVLSLCEAPLLAQDLSARGPVALTELSMDKRSALAARVEPTLRPSLKSLLQIEAVEMERSVGTATPCRLVVFGRVTGQDLFSEILKSEFPGRRGTAISLMRPSTQAFALFDHSRHQLLWPESSPSPAPRREKRPDNVERVRFSNQQPEPGELWNLSRLAALSPEGLLYSSLATKPFFTITPGEILRYGGLVLAGAVRNTVSGNAPAEILLASGLSAAPANIPIAFIRPQSDAPTMIQEDAAAGRVRVFLQESDNYGRIDFDPADQTATVSLMRSKSRTVMASMTVDVSKHRRVSSSLAALRESIESELAEAIAADLKGPRRRERAESLARQTAAIAYPMACRYAEWLERNPEAPVFERERRLEDLEKAMTQDVPAVLTNHAGTSPALLRRDLFRAFSGFLTGWGLRSLL